MSEDQVAALNRKIEQMGEAIIGQLEKKLAGKAQPAEPAQDETRAAMLSKIGEMERTIKDFQEKSLAGTSQIKNMEESKIGAHREIEDLLKAVKEQQKYSELDRQMHTQLEKAWGRVEDMEKRLLDFFGTVSNRAPQGASAEDLVPQLRKIVEAGLDERLRPVESALRESAAKSEAAAGASSGAEARVREISAGAEARIREISAGAEARALEISASVGERLDVLTAEVRRLQAEAAAGKELMAGLIAEVKKELLTSARENFAAGNDALARQQDALSALRDGLEKTLRAGLEAAAADVRAENGRQLERIRDLYGLSASSQAAMASVSGTAGAVEASLSGVVAALRNFLKGWESSNMGSMIGVSGDMIRKNFKAAGEFVGELEKESLAIVRARGEMDANIARAKTKAVEGDK